ncbi:sigma factor G inhibitor Gin [Clostridium frigidicarnis]|uniref:Inhibitor of sigma-G Gin n=1 Tax=Clostridium frigidicarnis TaxID=84698 RepID=A0A1I1AAK1_9CLOT|nr:sigma factor G inhibitor Gin [Clostridium frigidicarnis]SFB35031.1 Inhibitor of sigma-G Gin [Clostridium frigidicarnis]
MREHVCIICRKKVDDGLVVKGKSICYNCECRIINSKQCTDFYEYYMKCVKKHIVRKYLGNIKYIKGISN